MAETNKKITKKDNYAALLAVVNSCEANGMTINMEDITFDSLRDFIEHEVELLDSRAAVAQKRAAARKEQGDAMREVIYGVLAEDKDMTVLDILKALNDENVTAQMVTARLTQLIKAGKVDKTQMSISGEGRARRINAYRRIG